MSARSKMRSWARGAAVLLSGAGLWTSPAGAGVNDGWVMKITAVTGDHRAVVTLGAYPDASDGYDAKYDAPVFLSKSITLPSVYARFSHPEWERAEQDYIYDIRSLAPWKEWVFEAESVFADQDVKLEWDGSTLPEGYTLTLTDKATAQVVDMSKQSSYSYPNTGTPRSFTVVAQAGAGAGSPGPQASGAGGGGGGGGGAFDAAVMLGLFWGTRSLLRRASPRQ